MLGTDLRIYLFLRELLLPESSVKPLEILSFGRYTLLFVTYYIKLTLYFLPYLISVYAVRRADSFRCLTFQIPGRGVSSRGAFGTSHYHRTTRESVNVR